MNNETQLYLALKNLRSAVVIATIESVEQADKAIAQYERELGPLPDWASAHNIGQYPVLYAQLYTRNGRRNGNAMIYHVGKEVFGVITDMGNTMVLNASELDQLFEIGDYIMDERAYEKRKRQRDDYIEPLGAD